MTTPYQPRSKKKRRQIRTDEEVDAKAARIGKGNISNGIAIAVRAYPERIKRNWWSCVCGYDMPKPLNFCTKCGRNAPESEKE